MSFKVRSYNIEKLYYWSKNIYQQYYKKGVPWNETVDSLLKLPEGSLGSELGIFLKKNNFKVEPKLENHDVFHVLTGIGTTVPDEVALQFYLLANGKFSPYLAMVVLTGFLVYPERWSFFLRFYLLGLRVKKFFHLDFEKILSLPLQAIKKEYIG